MSGAGQQTALQSARADEIKIRAAAWLEQRDCAGWTSEGQVQLDMWLNGSVDHRVEFLRVKAAWDRTERLAVLQSAENAFEPGVAVRRFWPRLFGAMGGVAILVLAAGVTAAYFLGPPYTAYTTTVGGHETLTLDDRTQIELNTDTAIRVLEDQKERRVILDKGEAFFQVTHDTKRPFSVLAGGGRVTDLGTKFLVRRDDTRLEVAVMEGKARFDPGVTGASAKSAVLLPGDVAVATPDTVAVTRVSTQALNNQLGWRRGVLVFQNATLAQAADELNRYNHEKLIIAGAATGRLTFGATLLTTDVEAFADVAKDVLGLHVEKRGGEIVISR
jgi:transmembrane sensor